MLNTKQKATPSQTGDQHLRVEYIYCKMYDANKVLKIRKLKKKKCCNKITRLKNDYVTCRRGFI